jgi:hypothetical protein
VKMKALASSYGWPYHTMFDLFQWKYDGLTDNHEWVRPLQIVTTVPVLAGACGRSDTNHAPVLVALVYFVPTQLRSLSTKFGGRK